MTSTADTQTADDSTDLPRWDLSEVFPSLDSREFAAAAELAGAGVDRLVSLYDRHDVRGGDRQLDDAAVAAFEEVVGATNDLYEQLRTLRAFVYSFVSTDATDETAQRHLTRLQRQQATLGTLQARLGEWLRSLGVDALVQRSPVAADHAFPVLKAAERAEHQMTEAEESLASDLSLTGGVAWSRLYSDVSAGITAPVTFPDGRVETLPIFGIRGLATHADRGTREAAYRAELAAWEANEVPIAAALNAIKGETITLNRRRGWSSDLDAQLFGQNVDRPTLDAMLDAMETSFPVFRRYFAAKARLLGVPRMAFFDLFAPVGDVRERPWHEATSSVEVAFDGYGRHLGDLARRATVESWIDVGPRRGKAGGAFCMSVRADESRILMNYDGSFDSFRTLAHELGHAYHNTQLAQRTELQKMTPAALAETASIFCETIMFHQGLAAATDDQERLAILEVDLQGAAQVIVDIASRFRFESAVLARRAETTLSPSELCELMRDAQLATYGDGLDPDLLHPYMWAAKPHYYGSLFYNWPYAFGLLFGLGLYARYVEDPERFAAGYDDLLSATGLESAVELAARFEIDVRQPDFWAAGLGEIAERVDDFERMVGKLD